MEPLVVKNTIIIDAPVSKVWDVLTNPEQTKKYMFGCETISDWKPGSELLWQLDHEGKKFVAVKGNIVEIKQDALLSYTVIDPNNAAIADIPENYLTVTYELSTANGQTVLNVTQGDYNVVAEAKKDIKKPTAMVKGGTPYLFR